MRMAPLFSGVFFASSPQRSTAQSGEKNLRVRLRWGMPWTRPWTVDLACHTPLWPSPLWEWSGWLGAIDGLLDSSPQGGVTRPWTTCLSRQPGTLSRVHVDFRIPICGSIPLGCAGSAAARA